MNLSVQEIKNNLVFPVLPSEATSSDIVIPNEIINTFTNPDSELTIGEKFTDEEKNAILNYIDDLYLSSSAVTEFNKITQPISIIPVKENTFQGGVLDLSQGEYPVILFDENFLNGNTEPIYISPNGTLHQFDLKLIFMHELIHVVTGLPDTEIGDSSVFDSPEKALGPTQEIANEIHKELIDPDTGESYPEVVSYDSILPANIFGENITQFTQGKIKGADGRIDIGAFLTDRRLAIYDIGTVNTENSKTKDGKATNDLFLYIQNPNAETPRDLQILTGSGNDYLYGSEGNDNLWAGEDNDYLYGGAGNDELRGNNLFPGTGEDTAEFSDIFENYDIETDESNPRLTTITHAEMSDSEVNDGTDTLYDIEWGLFDGNEDSVPLGGSNSNTASAPPRIIPLPLEDGVEQTEFINAVDTTVDPHPNDPPTPPHVTITTPVAMLDGDIDYTLNISPYKPDNNYNIVYIIDTSLSVDPAEFQVVKNAYIDLTNHFINQEIADNINFGIVSFDNQAFSQKNLTANQAINAIQGLTTATFIGTDYDAGLWEGINTLFTSPLRPSFPNNPNGTTSIGYFFSDGQNSSDRFTMLNTATSLRTYATVQAFGVDDSNSLVERDINWIDSNDGVMMSGTSQLSTELLKSGLADDVVEVNILVDGEVVETVQPSQLTDSPLGLTYEGEIDELDVSIDAENIISAEVVFTAESNLATTTISHTVTAGEGKLTDENGDPIDESNSEDGDQDPFERERNGTNGDDDITLGYVDRGANGGAGADYIVGNNRDNILDGGEGNDIIFGYDGDDTITPGAGDDNVDGGEGIDTVLYSDVVYEGNNSIFLRQAANSVSYNTTDTLITDTLTNVEFLQFSDVRISADTLEITPIVEIAQEITVTEGNSGNQTTQLTFNLSTPAAVDLTFDYSTEDLTAIAGEDYLATSGQITIPPGETTANLDLEIIGDRDDEGIESFSLNLSALTGATFADNQTEYRSVINIDNDDLIESLFLVGDEDDNFLKGNILPDVLLGEAGNDTLRGVAGDDTLYGGEDNDFLEGQEDNDALYGEAGNDTLNGHIGADLLDGGDNIDSLYGGNGDDSLYGGDGDDTLSGQPGNDFLDGQGGNDQLVAAGGDDTLFGAGGSDTLFAGNSHDSLSGGDGDDTLHGGFGVDLITETGDVDFVLTNNLLTGKGTDKLFAMELVELQGGVGNNTISAASVTIFNVTLEGAAGDDTLIGGGKADVLRGQNDNDRLEGRNGNDNLTGAAGEDLLLGNNGNDSLYGGDDDDTLWGGNHQDLLNGGNGDDSLYGGSGNDSLYGGNGDDSLYGDEGVDTLFGGSGSDIFVIGAVVATDGDIISDFDDGVDYISLGASWDFADLNIVDNAGQTGALIQDGTNENQLLATIEGLSAADLTSADFV